MLPTQRIILPKLTRGPKALAATFGRINAVFRILQAMVNMEGRGGIKITKAEANWVIEYKPDETPAAGSSSNVYNASLSVAGTVPTPAEIVTAIQGVTFDDDTPLAGDTINLTVSGDIKFRSILTQTAPADTGTLWSQTLSLNSETWYAMTHQTGLY